MRWSTLIVTAAAAASVRASTLTPPVLPLAVRNPYMSAWLGNAREPPWEQWPMFWTGHKIGFSILASVPEADTVYPLLGRAHDSLPSDPEGYYVAFPKYVGATFDASTTNLTYHIPSPGSDSNHLELILSFLSPITPTSTLRQSIPASYITVHVKGDFGINVYLDINGQWVSGDRDNKIKWDFSETTGHKGLKTWTVQRDEEALFTEINDRAEWGTVFFTGPSDAKHEAGTSALLRQDFSKKGTLKNRMDEDFRNIMDEEPVFAFSKAFKLNGSSEGGESSDSALFTVGLIQDPVVQYASARGLTLMRPLWESWFKSVKDLRHFHYHDFHNAAKLAHNYSTTLAEDALKSGSENYRDIVALSARQIMGATTFSGTPDNPILFLKEISSNGNFQTIDVIFPSFPFFLYTNPRWLAYLLEPLLEHQLSGQYPNDYSMHDIGAHFPNATGHPDGNDEYMPVEECGDMLIMGLALVNSMKYDEVPASVWSQTGNDENTEDSPDSNFPLNFNDDLIDEVWGGPISAKGDKAATKWLGKSYKLWKQWTGYLVRETLIPRNQLSTDDFAGWLANQTNLALKGIIGIKAMSEISEVMGEKEDAKFYRNVSDVYIKKWEEFGISRDGTHAKLAYTWYGSWTTLYNLFADSLLCFHLPDSSKSAEQPAAGSGAQKPLNLVGGPLKFKTANSSGPFIGDHIYKMESDWYHNVMQRYGLPLDSRHLYTKSDWEFFAAAVTSEKVRGEIVDAVALWVNETSTDRPMTDLYDTEGDGGFPGINFMARPVVGGHFSFLALERACGGQAVAALDFLNKEEPKEVDIMAALDFEGVDMSSREEL